MAEDKVYTFDQQSMRRISAAVQKSEGVKDRKGSGWYPVKGGGTSIQIQIGKTTAEWAKGSEATIDVWKKDGAGGMEASLKEDGTAITFKAYNLFVDVEADKFVACVGGWLVAAECSGE